MDEANRDRARAARWLRPACGPTRRELGTRGARAGRDLRCDRRFGLGNAATTASWRVYPTRSKSRREPAPERRERADIRSDLRSPPARACTRFLRADVRGVR